MNKRSRIIEEMKPLLVALADGGLDERQHHRWIRLLRSSEEAREIYCDFVIMHAHLKYEYASLLTSKTDESLSTLSADGQIELDVDPAFVAQLLDEGMQNVDDATDEPTNIEELEALPKVNHKKKKWDAVLPPDSTPITVLGVPLSRALCIAAMVAVVTVVFLQSPQELTVVARGKHVWALMLSTATADREANAAALDKIRNSFRVW